jgi:polygalacturonase
MRFFNAVVAAGVAGVFLSATTEPGRFNVKDYGAVGDGKALETVAIQKTIDAAAKAGGGEVDVPAGTYLSGSFEIKSHITLNVEKGAKILGSDKPDDYPMGPARWEGIERQCHEALIYANDAEDIAIIGAGIIEGNQKVQILRNPRGPTLVEPIRCKQIVVRDVTLKSHRCWTLHLEYCQDATVSNVTFACTGLNADGIDPDSASHVLIDHCTFTSGDDDIAIKSGKGKEGAKIGIPSTDITITHCTFLKGTTGVACGSECSGGISDVRISDCTFKGAHSAINLKSAKGRGAYIKDITAEHLVVTGEPVLDLSTIYTYNPDTQPVEGPEGLTVYSNIVIRDVVVNAKTAIKVSGFADLPADGVTFEDFSGECTTGSTLRNVKNLLLRHMQLTGIVGPPYYVQNVQGRGLDGAAPYVEPATKPARNAK